MAVKARTDGNRAVLTNEDGAWHVWLRFVRAENGAVVGPGHIGRVIAADGTHVVEDFFHGDPNLNDTRNGGLGSFGCHLHRRNEHFPDGDVWNYTWNFTSRMTADDHRFGICRVRVLDGPRVDAGGLGRLTVESAFSDMYSYPNPIFLVRHTYTVYPRRVEQQIDVASSWDGSGPKIYVKEPKLTCHSIGPVGGPRYRFLSLYAPEGDVLLDSFDIWSLPSPMVHTKQLAHGRRCRLVFVDEDGGHAFTAVIRALGPQGRSNWHKGLGMDKWATDANAGERLVSECKPYCLQGPPGDDGNRTLSRNWELGRWASGKAGSEPDPAKPHVGVGLHAWEGGFGAPDCLCASRVMPKFGTTYKTWACYSLSDGWTV
jgi:hypothetical protein